MATWKDLDMDGGIEMSQRVIIIGAGIEGSSLANILAERKAFQQIVVLDVDMSSLPGSTGHAPGFVGQLNEIHVLTELAKRSVQHYVDIPNGFDRVGDLEVALSKEGGENLKKRYDLAQANKIPAEILDSKIVLRKGKGLVADRNVQSGLLFPKDGTANAQAITMHEKKEAQSRGVVLFDATVNKIRKDGSDHATGVSADKGDIHTGTVVCSTGIWSLQLLPMLPVYPVAHPNVHSTEHAKRDTKTPFIRWPERHV